MLHFFNDANNLMDWDNGSKIIVIPFFFFGIFFYFVLQLTNSTDSAETPTFLELRGMVSNLLKANAVLKV